MATLNHNRRKTATTLLTVEEFLLPPMKNSVK